MTANELAERAAAESEARLRAADDEALLAAESFSFGVFDRYVNAKVADIERRITQRFGTATGPGMVADPASFGRPNE